MCVRSLSRLKNSRLTVSLSMFLNCGLCTAQCPGPGTQTRQGCVQE